MEVGTPRVNCHLMDPSQLIDSSFHYLFEKKELGPIMDLISSIIARGVLHVSLNHSYFKGAMG